MKFDIFAPQDPSVGMRPFHGKVDIGFDADDEQELKCIKELLVECFREIYDDAHVQVWAENEYPQHPPA